jgi:hypothetical protein
MQQKVLTTLWSSEVDTDVALTLKPKLKSQFIIDETEDDEESNRLYVMAWSDHCVSRDDDDDDDDDKTQFEIFNGLD